MKDLPLSSRIEATAKELARIAKCSVPTVYRRLQVMRAAGAVISETVLATGKTGPRPVRYRLVKAAP